VSYLKRRMEEGGRREEEEGGVREAGVDSSRWDLFT